jgi:hypothetical protein
VKKEKEERNKTQVLGWKGVTLEGGRERERETDRQT